MNERLTEIEARRAARKAALARERDEQLATDLEAIDALEQEHGDTNVAVIRLPYTPGLPAAVAAKCPPKAVVKRYRARIKPDKQGRPGDAVAAAQEVVGVCLIYPDKDTFEKLVEARPGIDTQLGTAALNLAAAEEEELGNG